MSKYYHIRWSESDNEQLRKAVKNFNAKISRLEKKHPEMKKALPEKVSVKQMKELIDTRQDLKRELNALRRFSKRGAEELVSLPNNDYNTQITRWQKNEMSRRMGVINRKRKNRLEKILDIEKKSRGESLGYTVGQIGMGKTDEVALRPMNAFTPKMDLRDVHKKYKSILKESQSNYWDVKQTIMKDNYKREIIKNFNPEDVKEIVDAIDNMSFDEFYDTVMSNDSEWEFPYPPDDEQYPGYLSALRSIWLPIKREQ